MRCEIGGSTSCFFFFLVMFLVVKLGDLLECVAYILIKYSFYFLSYMCASTFYYWIIIKYMPYPFELI